MCVVSHRFSWALHIQNLVISGSLKNLKFRFHPCERILQPFKPRLKQHLMLQRSTSHPIFAKIIVPHDLPQMIFPMIYPVISPNSLGTAGKRAGKLCAAPLFEGGAQGCDVAQITVALADADRNSMVLMRVSINGRIHKMVGS